MNLGNRRVTNDELVAILEGDGFGAVSAYQASGNLILSDADHVDDERVSRLLEAQLGYPVSVFVRTAAQLEAIVASSPVRGRTGPHGGKPQIVFLREPTDVEPSTVLGDEHEVHSIGPELHWLPPAGLAGLGDVQKAMDRAFGLTTVRTLGTVERLVNRMN